MKKLLLLALISGLFLTPALADRSVEESVSADRDGEVSIELISGDVTIIGWDRSEVAVSGTVGDDVEAVEVEARDGRVSIEVELVQKDRDNRSYNDAEAELEIRVPVGSRIEAESVSAGFTVTGVDGAGEIESVSGRIEVDGGMSEVQVSTVSGRIVVSSDRPLRGGEFESVSGDIEFDAEFDGGDFSFESVSGDITLRLPSRTSAEFDIETFSGSIDNAFGPKAERTDEHAPGKELEFEIGGGDASVEIETFSGSVELRTD